MSSQSIGSDPVDERLVAADALADKGELDLAVDAYLAVIASEPQLAQAHCRLGTVYQRQNELTKAEACFWQATQLLPDGNLRRTLTWLLS